jgi:hypothetical protein
MEAGDMTEMRITTPARLFYCGAGHQCQLLFSYHHALYLLVGSHHPLDDDRSLFLCLQL